MDAPTPHVVLLPFPFASHPGSLFILARAFAAAVPDTAFSYLCSAQSLTALRLPSASGGNLRFYAVADGCPSPPPAEESEQIRLFLTAAPGNLRDGVAAAVAGSGGAAVSCVVSDGLMLVAGDLAEELEVPWVALWLAGPSGLSPHLHGDLLRRTFGVGEQALLAWADETLDFVPGLSVERVRDLPEWVLWGDLESFSSLLFQRIGKELPRAAAFAVNSFEGLHTAIDADFKAKFKEYLPVGPINFLTPPMSKPDDAAECLSWLDRQHPTTVAYISFGTVVQSLPPNELVELTEGLEASRIPFLWSLNERLWEHLPYGFLDRTRGQGLVVAWAPQVQVLGHPAVGVFLTHGGWNSLLESISSGVPMVCRPSFGDQMLNERMVSRALRIGVGLEGRTITREAVACALNMVLKENGGKIRERIYKLKGMAIEAVGPGGSSIKNFNRLLEIICRR